MERDALKQLVRSLDPRRTTLFLGAGAAHSSGAPLSLELCRYLEGELAQGQEISEDLMELAGILENRTSRKDLVQAIVRRLAQLEPDGGLIALANQPWLSIYTTNFDCLVERAYGRCGAPLSVVRSHFDWELAHTPGTTPLFKIHGCITQDRSLGHRSSMIVTTTDYVEFDKYRGLLFDRLKMEIAGNTTVIIGYSLKDPHVRHLADEALRLQREAAAPGRLYLLMHESDPDRASLWRSRGIHGVIQGDLNDFAFELASASPPDTPPASTVASDAPQLPQQLAACTVDVRLATQPSNPKRLFYGGAASYGDIRGGLTFERDVEPDLQSPASLATVITGAAGTGKTTLARRLVQHLAATASYFAFEHRQELPLQVDYWVAFERKLAEAGRRGVLLVDNCPPFQRQLNALVRRLPEEGALHLVVTAETSAWKPRQKDSRLFSHAKSVQLSSLSRSEIRKLRSLVTAVAPLRSLMQPDFLRLTPTSQDEKLRRKCSADMFVCLKAIFSSDTLDDIVLREYAAIDQPYQAVYRTTAALEAAGALPHRQMVLRVTGLPASLIAAALEVLEDLVSEQEHSASSGIYLWHTRHQVIAALITKYKYSDPEERRALLEETIATANPSFYEEIRTLRELCNSDLGIRSLPDASDRIALYQRIVEVLPADRVARHRLVRELIEAERLGDAEAEFRNAVEDVGLDPPLQRYAVRLHILRSRGPGLLDEDRRAILREGMTMAAHGRAKFADSKYMYFAAADVAEEWYEITGERGELEAARDLLEEAYERLLDPELRDRAVRMGRI